MTHVFDMDLTKIQIGTDMAEWEKRYPVPGPNSRLALDIVGGWRTGDRKTLPEEMPKELIARRSRKSWPDAFTTVNGLHVVSARAKDVIERFDPDLHQFFPLSLRTKSGDEIEGPWFAMNVTVRQDSIVVERSNVYVSTRAPDRLCSINSRSKPEDIVVQSERLSPDIHFWREARFQGSLLGSDAFVSALKAEGVRFFPSFRAAELTEALDG